MRRLCLIILCLTAVNNVRCTKQHVDVVYNTMKPLINNLRDAVGVTVPKNPEGNVRFTEHDSLCTEEQRFLRARAAMMQPAFTEYLDRTISKQEMPRIAVCVSGGGFRAMISGLGMLDGLRSLGLFDCVTYYAGLSGSVWAYAPWIASKYPFTVYKKEMVDVAGHGIGALEIAGELTNLVKEYIERVRLGHNISVIDAYGSILGKTILGGLDVSQKKRLSKSHAWVVHGTVPMPIYTTIAVNEEPYCWFEITPFEVGSSDLSAYVKTDCFGRKYKDGHAVNATPEPPLEYIMGVCGSAFAIDLQDAVRHTAGGIEALVSDVPVIARQLVRAALTALLDTSLAKGRIVPSTLPNFMYKIKKRLLSDHKFLCLVDAGIDFNLPLPPLLRRERAVDMIIICDASADGDHIGRELENAIAYANRKKLNMPPIDTAKLGSQLVSVWSDPTERAPVIVYVPLLKNSAYNAQFDPVQCMSNGFCNTLNFEYSPSEFDQLFGLVKYTILQHKDVFKQAVNTAIAKHNRIITDELCSSRVDEFCVA